MRAKKKAHPHWARLEAKGKKQKGGKGLRGLSTLIKKRIARGKRAMACPFSSDRTILTV